jgi:hypothetical protein
MDQTDEFAASLLIVRQAARQLKTCLAGTKNNGVVLRHFIIDATLEKQR